MRLLSTLMRSKLAWLTLGLALTLGLLAAWRLATYGASLPFDARAWKAAEANWNDASHQRARMADKMLSSGRLIGMRRDDVTALLGEPDHSGYFSSWDLVYNLGAERGYMSIDSEWLVIRLGTDGRVRDAQLARD